MYTVDGVIHYCVANMPGAVPITSTRALTNVTLPYVEELAELGTVGAITANPELARGVNIFGGTAHVRGGRRGARHGVHAARRRARRRRRLTYGTPGRFALRAAEEAALPGLAPPFAGDGVSGLSGFFGFRSVGKILITAYVISGREADDGGDVQRRAAVGRGASSKAAVE